MARHTRSLLLAAALGCGAANKGLTNGSPTEQLQQRQYETDVAAPLARAEERTKAGMPRSLDDLRAAHWAWWTAYEGAYGFYTSEAVGSHRLGDCDAVARKSSKPCQDARKVRSDAARTIAAILHAASEVDPDPGMTFPAAAITQTQRFAEIADQVKVDQTVTELVMRWQKHWTAMVKKAGSAKALARTQDKGMCFFSSVAHGKDVKLEVLLTSATKEIFVRCFAPAPLRSYKHSKNDVAILSVIGMHVGDGDNVLEVKKFPIHKPPAVASIDFRVPMRHVLDEIKGDLLKLDPKNNWPYFALDIEYSVGANELEHTTVARGVALLHVGDDTSNNQKPGEKADKKPIPPATTRTGHHP